MTPFLGFILNLLVSTVGAAFGCVLTFLILTKLIDPKTRPFLKRHPKFEKLMFLRFVFLIGGWCVPPIYLHQYLWRFPDLRPYLSGNDVAFQIGPFLGLVLVFYLGSLFGKDKGFRKTKDSVRVGTVNFSGTHGKTTVSFIGLEVVEDPKTKDRYGAGPDFERKFPAMEKYLPEPKKTGLRKKGWACASCAKALDPKKISPGVFVEKLSFEGMKPFELKVQAPMAVCEACGKQHIPDAVELEEAEIAACEEGRLCWDVAQSERKR